MTFNENRHWTLWALISCALCSGTWAADEKVAAARPEPFTLTVTGDIDAELAPVAGRLTTVFYQSYPRLVQRFENPDQPAPRHLVLVFDRDLKIPGFCSGGKITVGVNWLREHPDDLGLLTHELTHAVQAYPSPDPSWLTEGLADYARHQYGPNPQKDWALPERLTQQHKYTDSYRVTARFLVWLDEQHPGVVDKLHRRMQQQTFDIKNFEEFTGSSIDELWRACVRALNQP